MKRNEQSVEADIARQPRLHDRAAASRRQGHDVAIVDAKRLRRLRMDLHEGLGRRFAQFRSAARLRTRIILHQDTTGRQE